MEYQVVAAEDEDHEGDHPENCSVDRGDWTDVIEEELGEGHEACPGENGQPVEE